MSNPEQTRERASRASSRRGPALAARIVLTVMVIGGGVGWALYSTAGSAFEYYKHVDEISDHLDAWRDKPLQLHGFVVPGSIQRRLDRDQQRLEYKFLEANCGPYVEVRFAGVVPDTFKDGAEVVVKGRFGDGNVFQGTEVMAKCPSKYQMQASQAPLCSRGKAN